MAAFMDLRYIYVWQGLKKVSYICNARLHATVRDIAFLILVFFLISVRTSGIYLTGIAFYYTLKGEFTNFHQGPWRFVSMRVTQITRSRAT